MLKLYKNILAGVSIKESTCIAGDTGSIPGLGKSHGEGNGKLLQYSCLEISWKQENGGLQCMRSQRVGYDWATKQQQQKKKVASLYNQMV